MCLKERKLYEKEPLKESYHSAKYGGHRHSGSGDIMVLVCNVTTCLKGCVNLWVEVLHGK